MIKNSKEPTVPSKWSKSLQDQTRKAFAELRMMPTGKLHMKHKAKGYGHITWTDLSNGKIVLMQRDEEGELQFGDIDELLSAGWVID